MIPLLFYFFSGLAISSALCVVFLPKPARALLALIVTMFSLAGLFLLLGAYFVAMIHVIVYAGAVLVLFLFVIMMQGAGAQDVPFRKRFNRMYLFLACFTGAAFLGITVILFGRLLLTEPRGISGSVEVIGEALFGSCLLPFELTSVLLLLGVFAAIALAKKEGLS